MFEPGIVRGWLIPRPIYVGVLTGAVVFFLVGFSHGHVSSLLVRIEEPEPQFWVL